MLVGLEHTRKSLVHVALANQQGHNIADGLHTREGTITSLSAFGCLWGPLALN